MCCLNLVPSSENCPGPDNKYFKSIGHFPRENNEDVFLALMISGVMF